MKSASETKHVYFVASSIIIPFSLIRHHWPLLGSRRLSTSAVYGISDLLLCMRYLHCWEEKNDRARVD